LWFKVTGTPDATLQYGLFQSGAQYSNGIGGAKLAVSAAPGTYGPNKDSDGTYKVGIGIGSGGIWHTPASSVNVVDGDWHHYVATYDGSINGMMITTSTNTSQQGTCKHLGSTGDPNIKVYIDGEVCAYHANSDYGVSTIRFVGAYATGTPHGPYRLGWAYRTGMFYESETTISQYGWGFGNMHNSAHATTLESTYDELSFHNLVLTATQVGELYNDGAPVSLADAGWTDGTWATSNLVAWFRMFDGGNDNDTTIESVAGTVELKDWDDTAGEEGFVTSDPTRTITPTIKIKSGTGDEVITLTALADGDVYIP